MAERLDSRPGIAVSQACSLDKALVEFTASLLARGHPPSTITFCTNAVRHLVRWLREHHRGIRSLTERTVEEFLFNHLPTCKCPAPAPRDSRTLRAAVRRFRLLVKQHQEAGRPAANELSPLERELCDFHAHLQETCGLSEATCTYRLRYAREFMRRFVVGKNVKPLRIVAREVIEHVTQRAKGVKPGTIRVIADSIRSYLRWLQLRGLVDAHIVSAVPRIPQWRLTEIPKALSETQLKQLLRSFDLRSPSGRRDLAMALCMAEMGLRASEVAKLTLSDIDWRQGTIKIPTTKCRRVRLLPLSSRPGAAIAHYLRQGRPVTDCPQLFLRHTVPIGAALSLEMVRGAMRRAYARVGFPATWTGTHLLRHTAATLMHQKGATLKEIADVLGHLCIDTTAIYAKVNLPALKTVALPWPEVMS
jgi:integrase/recombinase XerD